jgi:Flp pilus assembly pilin Flp
MLDKMRMFPIMAYLALKGFASDLKKDERGLSGVVVAVLLILVAVLAVLLIWQLLGGAIQEWWERIMTTSGDLE